MQGRFDYKDIIKLHKAWADRYMLLWFVFVVMLFAGTSFVLEDPSTSAYVLLAAIVVIGAIWQAAGLTVARVHMLLEGVIPPDAQEHKGPPPDVIPGA
jgi:hypothetical protein